MKYIMTLIVMLFISSCATPADRRALPPDIVISSKKTAKEVAICIADKWQNTKPFMGFSTPPVNTNLKLTGYSISATDINSAGSTSTIALADVSENKLESTTVYYKMGGGGLGNYDQAVKECQ